MPNITKGRYVLLNFARIAHCILQGVMKTIEGNHPLIWHSTAPTVKNSGLLACGRICRTKRWNARYCNIVPSIGCVRESLKAPIPSALE